MNNRRYAIGDVATWFAARRLCAEASAVRGLNKTFHGESRWYEAASRADRWVTV